MTLPIPKPPHVCQNCWRAFAYTKPRPADLYCPHESTFARLNGTAWAIWDDILPYDVKRLRRQLERQQTKAPT